MDGELLRLTWRDHSLSLFRTLSSVRKKEVYCDATLACQGRFYPVHKFVLSTCSDYFEEMFQVGEKKHLMIVLTDIRCEELEPLLDYMYFGEVNVLQNDLNQLMKAAERLRIKGLAEPSDPATKEDSCEKRTRSQDSSRETKRRKWSNEGSSCPDSQSVVTTRKRSQENYNEAAEKSSGREPIELERESGLSMKIATSGYESTTDPSGRDGVDDIEDPEVVKLEPLAVKVESGDWQHSEMDDDPNMYTSQSGIKYLPPTPTLPTDSSLNPIDTGSLKSPQSNNFSEATQPLPGPSGLHVDQTWDHGGHAVPLPSGDYTYYRGTFPRYGMGPRKTGRPTSDIWNHYKTEKTNGKNYVICIYCMNQKYGYPNATKMKIHTVKCIKCPDEVREQYKRELAQMVSKSDASKSVVVLKAGESSY